MNLISKILRRKCKHKYKATISLRRRGVKGKKSKDGDDGT